ncbi:MAG: hypothetical protein WA484_10350 [Solirubrobacteraceae bacterium]
MSNPKKQRAQTLTPNQIVAHNLRRARMLRGWTQEATATRLAPLLGTHWSKASFSAAERSVDSERIRQFTADDLTAFAAIFELPVGFFFMAPRGVERIGAPGATATLTPSELAALAPLPEGLLEAIEAQMRARMEVEFGVTVIDEPAEGGKEQTR